jgi:hypothetical protein
MSSSIAEAPPGEFQGCLADLDGWQRVHRLDVFEHRAACVGLCPTGAQDARGHVCELPFLLTALADHGQLRVVPRVACRVDQAHPQADRIGVRCILAGSANDHGHRPSRFTVRQVAASHHFAQATGGFVLIWWVDRGSIVGHAATRMPLQSAAQKSIGMRFGRFTCPNTQRAGITHTSLAKVQAARDWIFSGDGGFLWTISTTAEIVPLCWIAISTIQRGAFP